MRKCSFDKCDTVHYAKDLCFYHYQKAWRKARAYPYMHKNKIYIFEEYAEVVLENRKREEVARAKIDIEQIENVSPYKWYLDTGNYVRTKHKMSVRMHNLIAGFMGVDHINGNRLDNRRINLRKATHKENNGNRRNTKARFGYKGVFKVKSGKYRASSGATGKTVYLGVFDTAEEAANMYDQFAIQHYGEFAHTNFEYI